MARCRVRFVGIGAVIAALGLAVVGVQPAAGTAPPPAPFCQTKLTSTVRNATDVVIPTSGTVSSTINVSGVFGGIDDVDVRTFIQHPSPADLDVTLRSPEGTVVTLTTDNGGTATNAFNGTVWDDDASPSGQVPYAAGGGNGLVTDHTYLAGTTASPLVPEDALGEFLDEGPNGAWTLTVHDDLASVGGLLTSWRLTLTTNRTTPRLDTLFLIANDTDLTVPNGPAVVTSDIQVSGAPPHLDRLLVTADLVHPRPEDIDMTVRSPEGTVVTLTTDNGGSFTAAFNGTQWHDRASPGGQVPYAAGGGNGITTDHTYTASPSAGNLVPEDAMSAFRGEDPNGTWRLTISDDTATMGGSLNRWGVSITAAECSRPDARLRLGGGALVGDDIYNTTGAGQTRHGSARPGGTATYTVTVQNDATWGERMRVRGSGPSPRFNVVYRNPGGGNITPQVTGVSGFLTPVIAAGARYAVTVQVTARSGAPPGASLVRRISVTGWSHVRDIVQTVTHRA